ncbi:MAG: membrane protein insertase YidC [Chloroflexi bacterium]|nr:membrane protein insertase YidC [Chloroflexota bacterium]
MNEIGQIWNLIVLEPMLNLLILLYTVLFSNFALAIIGLTIVVRVLTQPLLGRQMRSMKAMQELQPQLQALQKKYGKDREKMAEAQMKLYREAGINPLGGCLPVLVQMPVWIALYQAIIQVLGTSPEQLLELSQHIYPPLATIAQNALPINSQFLWLDLGQPDPFYVLPILVVFVFWLQQKMTTMPTADPQTASMNQSMQVMMPIMFGFFTLSVASGLAIYWIVSGVIGIVVQYRMYGGAGLRSLFATTRSPARRSNKRK